MSRIKCQAITFPDFRPLYIHFPPIFSLNHSRACDDVYFAEIILHREILKKLVAVDLGKLTSYQLFEAQIERVKMLMRWFTRAFVNDDEDDDVRGRKQII